MFGLVRVKNYGLDSGEPVETLVRRGKKVIVRSQVTGRLYEVPRKNLVRCTKRRAASERDRIWDDLI